MDTNESNARLFIIEGIPGSGKNIFHKRLVERFSGKNIYDFSEEELLFSWKHVWIENIDEARIVFYEIFLDYCEQILKEDKDSIFILNRFHVSYLNLSKTDNEDLQKRYENIIKKLSGLSAFLYLLTLDENLIEKRSSHTERTDFRWKIHLQRKMAKWNVKTVQGTFSLEQKKIISIVQSQNIPYKIVNNIEIDLGR